MVGRCRSYGQAREQPSSNEGRDRNTRTLAAAILRYTLPGMGSRLRPVREGSFAVWHSLHIDRDRIAERVKQFPDG